MNDTQRLHVFITAQEWKLIDQILYRYANGISRRTRDFAILFKLRGKLPLIKGRKRFILEVESE